MIRRSTMEFTLQNIGIIRKATIELEGLTVICGSNNSGKSTAGKALYATIESLSNLDEKLHDELTVNYRRALLSVSRLLDMESVARYVDFEKMQNAYQKDFLVLVNTPYLYRRMVQHENVIEAYSALKDVVQTISPEMFLEFTKKSKSDLPKKFFAYLENLKENREKALVFLAQFDKYFFDENRQWFAEKSVAQLFATEFKEQVYPANIKAKERKSIVAMSKNGEVGCNFTITEKKEITASVNNSKLFLNNAFYIEDPYALDKIGVDDEYSMFYRINNRMDYSHSAKLKNVLTKKGPSSLIEKSINKDNYDQIINRISEVIPGILTVRDSGMYYEEPDKEPLKVQNLATGSKMFSIIKSLLQKGEINFETMLILDEPEAHLHPEWQNIFAEIIVLLVKELDTNILLTTHSPNFLMAIEAYAKKYDLSDRTNYYVVEKNSDNYMVDYVCVNNNLSRIYSSFTLPLVKAKQMKDE